MQQIYLDYNATTPVDPDTFKYTITSKEITSA